MGKGSLTEDEIQDLKEWTFDVNVEDEHFLTRSENKNTRIVSTLKA